MEKGFLRYDKMVETALKGVVRDGLQQIAEHGLPGEHEIYITFRTDHPGTDIPDRLKERYPEEMTIVLQYQFWNLLVDPNRFSVTLSFNEQHEDLSIPFDAVTAFADRPVNFVLQFEAIAGIDAEEDETSAAMDSEDVAAGEIEMTDEAEDAGKVVALDAFRKK